MPYSEKQIAEWADRLDMELSAALGVDALDIIQTYGKELIAAVRKETREECARVCEEFMPIRGATHLKLQRETLENVAQAIRALTQARGETNAAQGKVWWRCERHDGYGFVRDCVVCNEQAAAPTPAELKGEGG